MDFSTTRGFSSEKLKDYVTQKDLKEKENIKRRDRGKRLEERESDLSKEERGGEIKEERSRKRNFFFSLAISICCWATVWSFSFHYAELISFCWRIDVRL